MSGIKLSYLGSPVRYDSEWLYYFENEIIIPALEISGGMQAECDIALPVMLVSGELAADGIITIPAMAISGKMQDAINGSLRIHAVSVGGEIVVSAQLDGAVEIPAVSVAGDMQAEGSIILEAMRIYGQLTQYGVITGVIAVPTIGIAGSAITVHPVHGAFSIPALSIFGVMAQSGGSELSGTVQLPQVQVLGLLSPYQDHSFGSETDAALKFKASRRLI